LIDYRCRTCGLDRKAIHPKTQECPDCWAMRTGRCLCTSDPSHVNTPCTNPPLPDSGGYCASCGDFRDFND
jgi:hypothetical protein